MQSRCKNGRLRCAHVASVLWYLGYYQYNDLETRPCQEYDNHLEDATELDSE